MGNAEQIAEWNGALGQRWVEMQREIEAVVSFARGSVVSVRDPRKLPLTGAGIWRDRVNRLIVSDGRFRATAALPTTKPRASG